MNKLKNDSIDLDDQLATFTDRVLGKTAEEDKYALDPEPELRALQQTILHLKNTFPGDGPSEVVTQRMRRNILTQWNQQKESKASESFWDKLITMFQPSGQKWQSQRSRQRWSVAVSLVSVAVLVLVGIPLLNKISSNQPATSGHNLNAGVFAATGALILLAVWLLRRKP